MLHTSHGYVMSIMPQFKKKKHTIHTGENNSKEYSIIDVKYDLGTFTSILYGNITKFKRLRITL